MGWWCSGVHLRISTHIIKSGKIWIIMLYLRHILPTFPINPLNSVKSEYV